MQVFHSLQDFRSQFGACVATIGKYDGMHLGHQRLLRSVMAAADRHQLPAVVILSEPHPEEYFAGDTAPPRLQHFHDKVAFLEHWGIDAVYCLRFDEQLQCMSAEAFVQELLVSGLGIRALVVGDDFSFGHQRRGNVALLQQMGKDCGFQVHEEPGLLLEGERVSSTRVRLALAQGDCRTVKALLGRPFSISGEVVKGRQLGRTLGFPTANILLGTRRLPLSGVFVVKAHCQEHAWHGVANVGYRPTVEGGAQAYLEVHLFDVSPTLYGKVLCVHFLHYVREERKFDGLEALKTQVHEDISKARQFLVAQTGVVNE